MTGGPTKTSYAAEENIYGRHGKLFVKNVNGDDQTIRWLSNVTEISATMTVDRLEVRRSGDRFVRYKSGEVTGEGTLTMDKVNSEFEKQFIKFVKRATSESLLLPEFELHLSLEDSGIKGIKFEDGFATEGHEEVILSGVNFWSMPFGFSLSDMISRDLDFTFTDVDFGGDDNNPHYINDAHFPALNK